MEYTKNYQSLTCVKEERIMMKDFNDMTGKLDEVIKTVTLTQSTSPIAVDMTDID